MYLMLWTTGQMEDVSSEMEEHDIDHVFKAIKEVLAIDTAEIVNIYWMGARAQMIVDESGLLADKPVFNPIAYGLYTAMALQNGHPLEDASKSPIAGHVMVLTDGDQLT